MTVKMSEKGLIKIKKIEDKTFILFQSIIPAIFYDKELKKQLKKREPVEIEIPLSISQIVSLYLKLKTFEDSFLDEKDSIVVDSLEGRVLFYRKDDQLVIKGIDYMNKKAGILYFKTGTYWYLLFLSYLKTFLHNFSVLSYYIDNNIVLTFEKREKTLTIEDRDMNKVHYLEVDEVDIFQELVCNFDRNGKLFTHVFTPDRNIVVTKNEFIINDKIFDLSVFRQIGYLTML